MSVWLKLKMTRKGDHTKTNIAAFFENVFMQNP